MPSINMIAARRAEKRRLEQNTHKLIYAIAAGVGLGLVLISVMVVRIVAANNRIADLNDRIQSLQGKVTEIQQLQDATAALTPKVSALTDADQQTLYWYSAMHDLASSLPPTMWLTSVVTSGKPTAQVTTDKDGHVTGADSIAKLAVQGSSNSLNDVGLAMLRMNAQPTIQQVTLNSGQESVSGDKSVVNFQLDVQLKPQADSSGGAGNVQKS